MTRFTFAGDVQNVQRGTVPRVFGRSYAIEAELEVSEADAEGCWWPTLISSAGSGCESTATGS